AAYIIHTLSLHDALPISPSYPASPPRLPGYRHNRSRTFPTEDGGGRGRSVLPGGRPGQPGTGRRRHATGVASRVLAGAAAGWRGDRKSTRLNSSHLVISY